MTKVIKNANLAYKPGLDKFDFSLNTQVGGIDVELTESDVRTLTEIFERVLFQRFEVKDQHDTLDYLLEYISSLAEDDDEVKQRVKEYFTNK